MNIKNADMPAMPTTYYGFSSTGEQLVQEQTGGLTKREHFAAMAMQGLIESGTYDHVSQEQYKFVAQGAVKLADALMAELEKEQNND